MRVVRQLLLAVDHAASATVPRLPPAEEERVMEREPKVIEIGSQDTVIIDKLFGPHIFANLRITADTTRGCWVIERQWASTGEYIEWVTIPDQINEEFTDAPQSPVSE